MENSPINDTSVPEGWEDLVSDLEETADDYRARGWNVTEIHPGDITFSIEEDEPKLKILVPDDEYFAITNEDSEGELGFDSYQIFRAEDGGHAYLLSAIEDQTEESVVLVPIYYYKDQDREVRQQALNEGRLTMVLYRLKQGQIQFEYTEPSLLFEGE